MVCFGDPIYASGSLIIATPHRSQCDPGNSVGGNAPKINVLCWLQKALDQQSSPSSMSPIASISEFAKLFLSAFLVSVCSCMNEHVSPSSCCDQ